MFTNLTINSTLDKLGFARFNGFSFEAIQELQKLYDSYFTENDNSKDLTVTHNLENTILPLDIHEKIVEIVKTDLIKILNNYRIFASHFTIKKARSEGSFQLHQDWSITDETLYKNFQIWIPLSTSYPENGGLCFIPESHTFFTNIRSGSLSIPRIPITEELHPYLSFCRLLKGEAVAFYTKTFHGSFINSSPEDRVGVILNIIEETAPTFYYHKNNTETIEKHHLNASTLLEHLPALEKGLLPFENFMAEEKLQQKDNDSICEEDLMEIIKKKAKEENRAVDYEHKETEILLDTQLEKQINKNGFAVIEFLTPSEIEPLKAAFTSFFPDRNLFSGSFSSMSALDNEQRKKAHDAIQSIIQPRLEKFFKDYVCPVSLFYSRRPDKQHKLDWHSDPSFNFNEHLVPIYGIWCPLQAVSESCGGLKLIPRSHRLVPKLNLTYLNWKWPLEDHRELLNNFGLGFELKAGQALIYDTRMIHSSNPNTCDFERDNIVMRIMPKQSTFFKYIKDTDLIGKIFSVSKDYFFTESAKNHCLEPENVLGIDHMFVFNYDLDAKSIKSYLSNF